MARLLIGLAIQLTVAAGISVAGQWPDPYNARARRDLQRRLTRLLTTRRPGRTRP